MGKIEITNDDAEKIIRILYGTFKIVDTKAYEYFGYGEDVRAGLYETLKEKVKDATQNIA